ncbi:peptidase S16, lon domain-containing protein [Scardovia inopinata]|uniref:Lon proteolytic domain-containing protein n=1 Tax=Scardovia inopinata F0304 TaxID=641146 RepID=W5IHE9_SCAIO|nr:S16 family serine protease [Scardovia inopinata]EFG26234.2 hypothetical protein HMPREF9020_01316 [Scardovia inopinata F0304]BAR07135.1 conserved hypothetical protein [Scardovia inopinata JCM 12537]SUV51206.1 peptidase S16, lon domain-containing protein [Scardovia inopinata]
MKQRKRTDSSGADDYSSMNSAYQAAQTGAGSFATQKVHPASVSPRWHRWISTFTIAVCIVLLFLPYSAYTIEFPGPTGNVLGTVSSKTNASEMISIKGVKTYKDSGKLLLTTVSATGVPGYPATNAQVIWAWFAKNTIVVPQEVEYPVNQSPQDYKKESTRQMSQAQSSAQNQAVAFLTKRGYKVSKARISMNVDNIGGPSAGMMYTLGAIDKMTAANETGGKTIAGTGTMEKDGKIGPIGGIRLKMVGAVRDGAQWFIAPRSNCNEVVGNIPAGLHVVAVSNLDQAYKALVVIGSGRGSSLPVCKIR